VAGDLEISSPAPPKKGPLRIRKTVLLALMSLAIVLAGGVALAVTPTSARATGDAHGLDGAKEAARRARRSSGGHRRRVDRPGERGLGYGWLAEARPAPRVT
jgi:hypothetical protein